MTPLERGRLQKETDGVFLQARMEDHGECMLVLIGATPEGKKELIGFPVGPCGKVRGAGGNFWSR